MGARSREPAFELFHSAVNHCGLNFVVQKNIFVLFCACVCGCVQLKGICVICLMRFSPRGRHQ